MSWQIWMMKGFWIKCVLAFSPANPQQGNVVNVRNAVGLTSLQSIYIFFSSHIWYSISDIWSLQIICIFLSSHRPHIFIWYLISCVKVNLSHDLDLLSDPQINWLKHFFEVQSNLAMWSWCPEDFWRLCKVIGSRASHTSSVTDTCE